MSWAMLRTRRSESMTEKVCPAGWALSHACASCVWRKPYGPVMGPVWRACIRRSIEHCAPRAAGWRCIHLSPGGPARRPQRRESPEMEELILGSQDESDSEGRSKSCCVLSVITEYMLCLDTTAAIGVPCVL
jgi:hypothetical protein